MLGGIYAPQLISFAAIAALLPAVLIACLAVRRVARPAVVVIFACGVALFFCEARTVVDSRISPEFVGDSIMTDVTVAGFPRVRGGTVTFDADVPGSPWVPRRIRVSWTEPPGEIRLGEKWRLELRLRRPRGASNPGGFDSEAWLFRKRIGATAFVVDGGRNLRIRTARPGPVGRIRQAAVDRLLAAVPDPDRAAVLAAVSVGARHLVGPERWQRYAATGTSHLMAISGLHVGMVAAVAYVLGGVATVLLGGSLYQHRIATLAAFSAAGAYALVSGLATPAQRATVMIGLAAVAVLFMRPARPFGILALTSAAIAFLDPLATLSPGFVLSFLAVLVLVWVAKRQHRPRSRLSGVRQLLRIQFALLFGLLPVTMLLFGRVAFVAPLVNMIAVPVFGTITVPLTLAGLLLDGPASALGDLALAGASGSLGQVERLIDTSLGYPAVATGLPGISGARIGLMAVPLIWVLLPPGWPGRQAALIAAFALAVAQPSRPEPGCAEITVIDVGQGLAVSILTRSAAVLYDTGPAYFSGGDAATNTILPFLEWRGVRRLDHLVVSHADADHAGGLATILSAYDVGHVHTGGGAIGPPWDEPCVSGRSFVHDRIRFEFLHPGKGESWDDNDASCVLQISAGEFRLLLTGDIEQAAETRLARSGRLAAATVVVVPHHGSRTSSTPGFVNRLRPALAIVSAGYGNRWGQPDADVVGRWRAAGATVRNTATSGAISFGLCEEAGLGTVRAHRESRRRLWHE